MVGAKARNAALAIFRPFPGWIWEFPARQSWFMVHFAILALAVSLIVAVQTRESFDVDLMRLAMLMKTETRCGLR